MNNTNNSNDKSNKIWGPLQWGASFFFFAIFATTVGTALYYRNNTFDYQISPALLTVDSLITGATITLIAFTNFSPVSSGSSSLFRRIYWVTGQLTGQSQCRERVLWIITGAFIKPHISIFISTLSTFVTIICFQFISHYNALFFIQTILMIVITFWIFFGTLTRYYLFNKYALRTSAKYLRTFFIAKVAKANNKKKKKKNVKEKKEKWLKKKWRNWLQENWFSRKHRKHINADIKKFVEYSNLLRATSNFELLQEIIWIFTGDEKIYENLNIITPESVWVNSFNPIYKILHPSSKEKNATDAYKLLLWNIFVTIKEEQAEENGWKIKLIKAHATQNIKKLNDNDIDEESRKKWLEWVDLVYFYSKNDVNDLDDPNQTPPASKTFDIKKDDLDLGKK